jgi:hypothetical protein
VRLVSASLHCESYLGFSAKGRNISRDRFSKICVQLGQPCRIRSQAWRRVAAMVEALEFRAGTPGSAPARTECAVSSSLQHQFEIAELSISTRCRPYRPMNR